MLVFLEPLEARLDAALAADHADVLGRPVQQVAQARLVVLVAAGDEHHIGGGRNVQLLHGLGHVPHHHLVGLRESFTVGEENAVVDDHHVVVHELGDLHQRHGDVAGADDDELGRRRHHLEEDIRLPPRRGLHGHQPGVLVREPLGRLPEQRLLQFRVVHRPQDDASVPDQALGAAVEPVHALGLHHGDEHRARALILDLDQLLNQFVHSFLILGNPEESIGAYHCPAWREAVIPGAVSLPLCPSTRDR